jgi:hypothetical protein
MGLIGPSGASPGRHVQSQGRLREEATSAEPQPFSHDRHFAVSAHSAHGYRSHAIEEIIVIGGNGQFVAVEDPNLLAGARRRKGAMLVPDASLSKGSAALRFLWGPARSVGGLSGQRPGAVDGEGAVEDHLKYRALHQRVLESVGDIALQAFLRFLERQTPSADDCPTITGRSRRKLAFRFQYDEHYLHERHAAQLAWKRFLAESSTNPDQKLDLTNDRA